MIVKIKGMDSAIVNQELNPAVSLKKLKTSLKSELETLEKLKKIKDLQQNQFFCLKKDFKETCKTFENTRSVLLSKKKTAGNPLKYLKEFLELIETTKFSENSAENFDFLVKTFDFSILADSQIERFFPLWKNVRSLEGFERICSEFVVQSVECKMKLDLVDSTYLNLKCTEEKIEKVWEKIEDLMVLKENIESILMNDTKDEDDLEEVKGREEVFIKSVLGC
jgi:uncharacterized protein YlbG (UPF0298 family)